MKRKLLTILLSLSMVLSTAVMAGADEISEGTFSGLDIIAENAAEETVEVQEDQVSEVVEVSDELLGATKAITLPATKDAAKEISFGTEYKAYPQSSGDGFCRAFFKFTTSGDSKYLVKAFTTGSYTKYNVYTKEGKVENGYVSYEPLTQVFLAKDEETYIVELFRETNKVDDFYVDFIVEKIADPEGEDEKTAYTLEEGKEYSSAIGFKGDVDYLKITPSKTGNYNISIKDTHNDDWMSYGFALEGSTPSYTPLGPSKSVTLSKKLDAGKNYYLVLAQRYSDDNNRPSYTVKYSLLNANADLENADATTLSFNGKETKINYADEGVEYWYKVTTGSEADTIYVFDIKNTGEKSTHYEIKDEKGNNVSGKLEDWLSNGRSASYSTRNTNTTYYLVFKSTRAEAQEVTVTLTSVKDPEGDTTETAYALKEDEAHDTGIGNVDTADYYKFTPEIDGKYTFTVNNKSSNYFTYAVYTEDGNTALKDSNGNSITGSITGSDSSEFTVLLSGGKTYYLLFSSSNQKYEDYSITAKLDFKFTDVPTDRNNWKFKAANYCYANGVISGTDKAGTKFAPDEKCTRAQMVKIVYNASDKKMNSYRSMNFSDVTDYSWWGYDAINWAYSNSITNGLSADRFGVNESITREQVAVFLYNYANKYLGLGCDERADLSASFTDADQIHSWAQTALSWANAKKIVNGDGKGHVNPRGNATRAEIATMMMNFLKQYGQKN